LSSSISFKGKNVKIEQGGKNLRGDGRKAEDLEN